MRLKVTSERMEDEGRVLVSLLSYFPGFVPCSPHVFRANSSKYRYITELARKTQNKHGTKPGNLDSR